MKAVALKKYLPIAQVDSFLDVELPKPEPTGRQLLVAVKAVAVNPVDTKVRAGRGKSPDVVEEPPRVLGWDASGVVEAVGPDATLFKPGDEVWYAGDITRAGCNSEFQVIDERIVGRKPKSLSHAEAAALPLTKITAYEALRTCEKLIGESKPARPRAKLLSRVSNHSANWKLRGCSKRRSEPRKRL